MPTHNNCTEAEAEPLTGERLHAAGLDFNIW